MCKGAVAEKALQLPGLNMIMYSSCQYYKQLPSFLESCLNQLVESISEGTPSPIRAHKAAPVSRPGIVSTLSVQVSRNCFYSGFVSSHLSSVEQTLFEDVKKAPNLLCKLNLFLV